MSERGEIEVLLPLTHVPSPAERKALFREAWIEARKLAATVNGRVLGLTKVARAEHAETGAPALRVTFAVDAPEETWRHRKSFALS